MHVTLARGESRVNSCVDKQRRSSLPPVEQAAVTDPAPPGGSTRRPACLLGTVAVPWTVAGRRVVDEPARRGPAAFVPRRLGGALICRSFNESVDRGSGPRLSLIRCGVGRWPGSAADRANQIFNTSVDRSGGRIYDQIDSPSAVREAPRPRRSAAGIRARTYLLGGQ